MPARRARPGPARSPPRPPGSARSSRSSCAGSSPASPSAPAAHSAWPRGSASCSCGSSCGVTSWLRDHPGAARFRPPTRPPPRPWRRQRHPNALRSGPAALKSPSRKFTPQPPPGPRVGHAAAVFPAPRPLAVSHWPRRLRGPPSHTPGLRHVWKVGPAQAPPSAAPPLPRPLPAARHFRQRASSRGPLPAGLVSVSHLFAFGWVFAARLPRRPRSASPFLPSGCGDPTGHADGHVAPGRRPPRAQPGIPAPSAAPAGTRLPSGRAWLSRTCGPGPALSVFGGAGPGSRGGRAGGPRPAEHFHVAVFHSTLTAVFEVLHLQYGMYVWPCAVVLAQYLWFHRRSLPGKAVLEIGGGVSLPGIMAAKCGAEVILSDSSELPHCLEVCRQSCQMNNLPQVRIIGLTWGHMSQELLALPPQDILLASDVFFEPEDFEDILTTVYFLMQKNPKVQLWSTYQVRSADWSLEALLYKWDMKCVHIPLESFDADKENIAESALPGRHTVEMLVISFAKDSL
uniref:Histone-arginine methyltransferase METTL23 n=3 Tax=Equus caballus TaxID=9796 RepID=A0A9L0SWC4_HORSE